MYNDVLYLELNQRDPVNNRLYNGGVDALAYITGEHSTVCNVHVSFRFIDAEPRAGTRGRGIRTGRQWGGRGVVLNNITLLPPPLAVDYSIFTIIGGRFYRLTKGDTDVAPHVITLLYVQPRWWNSHIKYTWLFGLALFVYDIDVVMRS